ncbi:PREDICTED: uncharacterized protein LOC109169482 [Ipomoea nil]|uniref:uncharacterized protein LOC109169482 n=1 Tax=Ipomoea nil TaxID=35883 RepID=UPI0009009342|nr:PREDICTED: uncharacterized protein LOC109169482 [Ipomoea nil]
MAGVTLPITESITIDIPILNYDNHKEWKDAVLLNLGILGFDYALRIKKPAELTAESTEEQKALYERWATANRLGVFLIKSKIAREIRGPVDDIEDIEPLLKAIDDQFVDANKSLTSTLIMQFINMRLSTVKGTRKHIMELRDIAAQLKKLKIILPDAFVVHFALNTLSQDYNAFKISYNTHKDEWSINQLITMCTQEETRLLTELGESAFMATTRPKRKSGKPKGLTIAAKEKLTPKADIKKIQKCFFCKKKGHMKKDCIKFQKWMSQKGNLRVKKIDHNVVREIDDKHEHQLTYKRNRELHKYLNSDYKFISRNTTEKARVS